MRRIVLLTDFGTRDPYVAAVKGVIASRCEMPIVDLTHEIAPFDVFGAAWFLRGIIDYWPPGTIFICVVDPGVGTARRIIALEHEGRIFLAPDNGLLQFVDGVAYSVEDESLFLPNGSTTFHGRDRFAPVAAALANGLTIEKLGPRVRDRARLDYEPPSYGDVIRGTIVSIDRFGNAITDIEASRLGSQPRSLHVRGHVITRFATTYGDAGEGLFLIVGSTGCLEISEANGSAAARLQLSTLDRVELWPT